MKTLSIRQPYATAVALGHKCIENRAWRPSYRGPLLIHASSTRDQQWFCREHFLARRWRSHYGIALAREAFPSGGIIAIARLSAVLTLADVQQLPLAARVWFEGPYGLLLSDMRALSYRPTRGALSLFECGVQIEQAIRGELGEQVWAWYHRA